MENSMNIIWSKLLEKCQASFDANAYNTFLSPLVCKDINGDLFVVEAPTRFIKEVVASDMFSNKINEELKNITGKDYRIEVVEIGTYVKKTPTDEPKGESIKISSNINPDFTFDNFVVGNCNIECCAASKSVANDIGNLYNPLFIYGRAGIGKTHLLHAIGNFINKKDQSINVYYTTANDFIDEFMRQNQNKNVDAMKQKFKSIDVLLLDDVQFLAGKDKTGEVFFQIFNNLFNEKKQIVLTSDRNPNDLRGLETRLVSRFASGLTVGMNAPEYETAKEILKKKIDSKHYNVGNIQPEVLEFVAQNYATDVRQLEGALTRLFFYVSTINKCDFITLDIAKEALRNVTPPKKNKNEITAKDVKDAVCEYYSITPSQLIGPSRVATLTTPRYIAIYLCRSMVNMKYEDIGREFGNRDHSTIISACLRVEKQINEEEAYRLVIDKLKQLLTN